MSQMGERHQTIARFGIERGPVDDRGLVGIEGVEQRAAEEQLVRIAPRSGRALALGLRAGCLAHRIRIAVRASVLMAPPLASVQASGRAHLLRSRKSKKPPSRRSAPAAQAARASRCERRLEFLAIAVTRRAARIRPGGRMQIDLAQTLGQALDQPRQALPGHLSRPVQAEDTIGGEHARARACRLSAKRRRGDGKARAARRARLDPTQHPAGSSGTRPRAGRSGRRTSTIRRPIVGCRWKCLCALQ